MLAGDVQPDDAVKRPGNLTLNIGSFNKPPL